MRKNILHWVQKYSFPLSLSNLNGWHVQSVSGSHRRATYRTTTITEQLWRHKSTLGGRRLHSRFRIYWYQLFALFFWETVTTRGALSRSTTKDQNFAARDQRGGITKIQQSTFQNRTWLLSSDKNCVNIFFCHIQTFWQTLLLQKKLDTNLKKLYYLKVLCCKFISYFLEAVKRLCWEIITSGLTNTLNFLKG